MHESRKEESGVIFTPRLLFCRYKPTRARANYLRLTALLTQTNPVKTVQSFNATRHEQGFLTL